MKASGKARAKARARARLALPSVIVVAFTVSGCSVVDFHPKDNLEACKYVSQESKRLGNTSNQKAWIYELSDSLKVINEKALPWAEDDLKEQITIMNNSLEDLNSDNLFAQGAAYIGATAAALKTIDICLGTSLVDLTK